MSFWEKMDDFGEGTGICYYFNFEIWENDAKFSLKRDTFPIRVMLKK